MEVQVPRGPVESRSSVELVEKIDPRLLANLSYNFRSPYEAIFELIDNGIASRLAGEAISVKIGGSRGAGGRLQVTAKGGSGMGLAELAEFLRWGKEPEATGLHRYGQGGKAAIGYLGRGFRLRCNRYDEETAYLIEDCNWLERPQGLKKFVPKQVTPASPGFGVVSIEIVNLRRSVNFKRLAKEAAWRYRPALTEGSLKLNVGRQRLLPIPLPTEKRHVIRRELTVPAPDDPMQTIPVTLQGWVGIAPPRFEERGGVRCSHYGRVVAANEYFGHPSASFKASLNSIVGEVDLWFVPVVLNKNAFDNASPAWEAVAQVMYDELTPFVNQLLRRRDSNEPTEEERMRAMEMKDLAQRALERIAAESERRGRGGQLEGRKPPEPREARDLQSELQRQVEQRERTPRTPPPPDAVRRLARKGWTLDWDVRALNAKERSATIEQGGAEIIINNQYPLYRHRNGDDLYMLETGLLEQLKPGREDDKTVDEYHSQVGEALYVATAELGAGRERTRARGRRAA